MSYVRVSLLGWLLSLLACANPSPPIGPVEPGSGDADAALARTLFATIVVDDIERAEASLRVLAARRDGSVQSGVLRAGDSPSASLTLRIPSDELDAFRAALDEIGDIEQLTEEVEDVTMQRADLGARLDNARAREARLRAMLEGATGNLADVLAVERELSRAREDVERMTAEAAALASRVDYATFSIELVAKNVALFDRPGEALAEALDRGVRTAWTLIVGAGVVIASTGPSLIAFATLGVCVVVAMQFVIRRSRARRRA